MDRPFVVIDFETRSKLNIKQVGPSVYASDTSTSILCLAWQRSDDSFPSLWVPGDDPPTRLYDAIEAEWLVEAHNVGFERCVWWHKMLPFGAPQIKMSQWRCTAARAAAVSLPRSLDDVGRVLDLSKQKDKAGHLVMMKCSRPRKPTKNDASEWNNRPEDLSTTYQYCKDDVSSEMELSRTIPHLSDKELQIFQLDMKINQRGVYADRESLSGALRVLNSALSQNDARMRKLTDGVVPRCSNVGKLNEWINQQGCSIPDTRAETLRDLVSNPNTPTEIKQVIKLRLASGKISVKKVPAMLARMDEDNRIRESFIYCGADRTGRWSSRGVQFQNAVRGKVKSDEQAEAILGVLRTGDVDLVETVYGNPIDLISNSIRSFISAPPGKRLIVADFSQIEARALAWLANQQDLLEVFASGKDPYKAQASKIFKVPYGDVTDEQRFLGKIVVLALGYQMGANKFKATVENFGGSITDEFAKQVVTMFREHNPGIRSLWNNCDTAAKKAILNPGKAYRVTKHLGQFDIAFQFRGRTLRCKLPSGRMIHYFQPEVRLEPAPWDHLQTTQQIRYKGTDSQQGGRWTTIHTYGGKLVENIVQATARDFMAEGMLRLDKATYNIIATIHDEVICEEDKSFGSLEEVGDLLTTSPEWGTGCPLGFSGFEGMRYRK